MPIELHKLSSPLRLQPFTSQQLYQIPRNHRPGSNKMFTKQFVLVLAAMAASVAAIPVFPSTVEPRAVDAQGAVDQEAWAIAYKRDAEADASPQ